jgi:hypothetical protein
MKKGRTEKKNGKHDARSSWAGFRFTVADNASDDEIGSVHDSAERDAERVA